MTLGEFRAATEKYGDECDMFKAASLGVCDSSANCISRVVIEICDSYGQMDSTIRIILI